LQGAPSWRIRDGSSDQPAPEFRWQIGFPVLKDQAGVTGLVSASLKIVDNPGLLPN